MEILRFHQRGRGPERSKLSASTKGEEHRRSRNPALPPKGKRARAFEILRFHQRRKAQTQSKSSASTKGEEHGRSRNPPLRPKRRSADAFEILRFHQRGGGPTRSKSPLPPKGKRARAFEILRFHQRRRAQTQAKSPFPPKRKRAGAFEIPPLPRKAKSADPRVIAAEAATRNCDRDAESAHSENAKTKMGATTCADSNLPRANRSGGCGLLSCREAGLLTEG